jgi:hypothetical protein
MVIVDLARTDSARARCSYATRNVIAQGARRRTQLFNDLRFADHWPRLLSTAFGLLQNDRLANRF